MPRGPFTTADFIRLLPRLIVAFIVGWLLTLADVIAKVFRKRDVSE